MQPPTFETPTTQPVPLDDVLEADEADDVVPFPPVPVLEDEEELTTLALVVVDVVPIPPAPMLEDEEEPATLTLVVVAVLAPLDDAPPCPPQEQAP